jgi:hypothetical protein
MGEERRRFDRQRVLRRGRIVFRRGHGAIDCVLLDISPGGARLRAPGLLAVPERFELRLDDGFSHQVEVRFRTAEFAGVQFLDAAPH